MFNEWHQTKWTWKRWDEMRREGEMWDKMCNKDLETVNSNLKGTSPKGNDSILSAWDRETMEGGNNNMRKGRTQKSHYKLRESLLWRMPKSCWRWLRKLPKPELLLDKRENGRNGGTYRQWGMEMDHSLTNGRLKAVILIKKMINLQVLRACRSILPKPQQIGKRGALSTRQDGYL